MLKTYLQIFLSLGCLIFAGTSWASPPTTQRIPQYSNDRVTVWKTMIYPSSQHILKMHRHEHDRVVVALTDGLLKITNNLGKVHYLKLEKNKSYYLTKDVPNEQHTDENVTPRRIEVIVIELLQ